MYRGSDRSTQTGVRTITSSRSNQWVNAAFLGRAPASVDDSAHQIVEVFSNLAQWVRDWISQLEYSVSFLDSSTAACNAALLALLPDCECILHTSDIHPTIRLSVETMAQISGRFGKCLPVIDKVNLRGIPLSSTDEFSRHLCDRITQLALDRPTVLILEHVTYNHGIRLPIAQVCTRLAATHPKIRIIIDGAQATGLWRPVGSQPAAYIGCFHKVVGSHPGTAFLAIKKPFSFFLPSHVGVLCNLSDTITNSTLHTIDLPKWKQTARIVTNQFSIGNIEHHIASVHQFNRMIDDALAPYTISLGHNHDVELRSHISTVEFSSEDESKIAFQKLSEAGYVARRLENLLRLSIGPYVKLQCATEIGVLLREEIEKFASISHSIQGMIMVDPKDAKVG